MGITGLIPFLKKSTRISSLSEFSNQCAAIDAYCWLHKGAFSCADKLVKGEPTNGYILYVMKQINLLLSYDIKPILVFDGCHLPSKAPTEAKRRQNRERNRQRAKELLREGKTKEAHEYFQRCVDITSEMAHEVIKACRARNVDIIVAPYEADAELAYLNQCDIADFIITEDSDLVLFGCSKILFKMDSNGGGLLFEQDNLHLSMGKTKENFNFEVFRNMCILSGCDYLQSLHGIGLAKAKKFFQLSSNPDIFNALCRLPSYLKMSNLTVSLDYREGFVRALNTIKHQLIFDPRTGELMPLTPYPEGTTPEDFPYCGKFVGNDRAYQIALGNVDVQSGKVVDSFDPSCLPEPFRSTKKKDINNIAPHMSIWHNYIKSEKPVPYSAPNALTPTTGKTTLIDFNTRKRKLEESECEKAVETETDFKKIYMEDFKDENLQPIETVEDASSIIDDEKKFREDINEFSKIYNANNSENNIVAFDDTVRESPVKNSEKESSPVLSSKRKTNPFAKANKSPRSKTLFSGLQSMSQNSPKLTPKINCIVKSRYFFSPNSPNVNSKATQDVNKIHSIKKEKMIEENNEKVSNDKLSCSPVKENLYSSLSETDDEKEDEPCSNTNKMETNSMNVSDTLFLDNSIDEEKSSLDIEEKSDSQHCENGFPNDKSSTSSSVSSLISTDISIADNFTSGHTLSPKNINLQNKLSFKSEIEKSFSCSRSPNSTIKDLHIDTPPSTQESKNKENTFKETKSLYFNRLSSPGELVRRSASSVNEKKTGKLQARRSSNKGKTLALLKNNQKQLSIKEMFSPKG